MRCPLRFRDGLCKPVRLLAVVMLPAGGLRAYDGVTPPEWAADAAAVHVVYLFADDRTNAQPDICVAPFGTPSAVVNVGEYGSGWQDPESDPPGSSGEPGSGAWDLGKGPSGRILIDLPVAAADPTTAYGSYRVALKVNVVGLISLPQLPSLAVPGREMEALTQEDTPAFGSGIYEWRNRTWTATVGGVETNVLRLAITADASRGSLVDTVEIYALACFTPGPATSRETPFGWYRRFGLDGGDAAGWEALDVADSDGDGMANWEEYVAGTVPTNAASRLVMLGTPVPAEGRLRLEWLGGTAGPATPYIIETAVNLAGGSWSELARSPRADGTNRWETDFPPGGTPRFYRVRATR